MIWRVALAGAVLAVLGGFFVGRVVADPTPLPAVRAPVNVGPSAKPTPSDDATTLRPRGRTPGDDRTSPGRVRTTSDDRFDDNDDNSGPGGGDDGGHGRGRGRGRGGDDDEVRTVGPSPRVLDDDDGGDDGGDDDGGDDGGGDD